MSLAKLTSVSTQTLSLLLERQRQQTLPSFTSGQTNAPHTAQINRNLEQLRDGIRVLEARDGRTEATGLLRNQYERMRGMLGRDSQVESLDPPEAARASSPTSSSSSASLIPQVPSRSPEPLTPYTDDPEAGEDPGIMLQTQRQMMDNQDDHLDRLSHSINRQRDLSIQINDELDVHTGLLSELDTDIDRTQTRMSGARRRLDRFAKGAKNNGSTMIIAALILILLVLIIIFKT
ncbi:hypothetical protein BD626DRAFT_267873 [Schizophyllum amplum]|uniref:t-SNARE coiled-coil homology domain-containing protein n=1 Tax=Schizophyllum amplum TaxID=97359 RepID=A0A550BTW4_9AGAR|nr:hypothetical protein BD626DRAFT_267873 [Auriculariopsis ampla]